MHPGTLSAQEAVDPPDGCGPGMNFVGIWVQVQAQDGPLLRVQWRRSSALLGTPWRPSGNTVTPSEHCSREECR